MNDKLAYEKNKRRIFMSKYEQAIKLLEMLSSDEFQQFTSSEFDDAIYMAIEALEKADKYRWHDLRKNPDDLPEADEYGKSACVLVMIGTPEWDRCELVYYNYNRRVWSSLYEQNAFAWRYIEPFKEEADEEYSIYHTETAREDHMGLGLGAEPDMDFYNHLCGYHNHRIHSGGDKRTEKIKEEEE